MRLIFTNVFEWLFTFASCCGRTTSFGGFLVLVLVLLPQVEAAEGGALRRGGEAGRLRSHSWCGRGRGVQRGGGGVVVVGLLEGRVESEGDVVVGRGRRVAAAVLSLALLFLAVAVAEGDDGDDDQEHEDEDAEMGAWVLEGLLPEVPDGLL